MAKFITDISLENLSSKEYLSLATAAIEKMEGKVTYVSESGLIADVDTSWSASSYGQEITITIDNGIVKIKSESKGSVLFDFGRNKKTVQRFLDLFAEVKNTLSPEELSSRQLWLEANNPAPEQDILNPNSQAAKEAGQWWNIFIPSKVLFVTPIIIDLCIVLFVLQVLTSGFDSVFSPTSETIIKWGGNYTPLTLGGEWWRLFTCTFEHIGIIHLAFNMYALLYIGLLLEPLLGRIRFAAAYIATGVIASVTSLWWHDVIISAGASGAIFGMYGLFGALLLTNLIDKSARKSLLSSIGIFIFYNLAYGMKSGVDNAAHIGGLISGFVIGFVFYLLMKNDAEGRKEKLAAGVAMLLAIVVSSFGLKNIRNDIAQYEALMKQFSENESKAILVYQSSVGKPDAEVLPGYKNISFPAWRECRSVINQVSKLSLPKEYKERNNLLEQYTLARITSDSLSILAIEQNSNSYSANIDSANKRVEEIINSLSKKK